MKKSLDYLGTTRFGWAILIAVVLAATLVKSAGANGGYQLEVIYTNGSIVSGPLSAGLNTLPASVTVTYTLGPGQPSTEPGEEDEIYFDDEDVAAASVTFGDATWTSNELESFSMLSVSDVVDTLTYRFSPIITQATDGIIIMNFPLRVIGTDKASGMPFEYGYTDSTQTLTPIIQTLTVAIDIKPGSDPNCFNINGHGVVPVAILGNADFNVSQIDLATVAFGGLAVRVRGNKGPLCSIDYSNEDAYLDMVCHFEDDAANWDAGDGEATLTGSLIDGTPFEGTDAICVVP